MEFTKDLTLIKNLLEKHKNNNITIIDDIDFDGLASASIAYSILYNLNYNVQVIPNTQHGLTNNPILDNLSTNLLIIVDSGTNEVDLLINKPYDVLIIDHHLNNNIIDTSNTINTIINFNGKNYKEYYNYSAGMLTYTIFNLLFPEIMYDNEHLEVLAYQSYYTDMVDLDEYILKFLIDFENARPKVKDFSNLKLIGSHYNGVRKSTPPDIIKKAFYSQPFSFANTKMANLTMAYRDNYKALLSFITKKLRGNAYELDNVDFYDLTPYLPFTRGELKSAKGTIASMMSRKLITITGLLENDMYYVSFRGKGDVLSIARSIQDNYNATFTGHAQSFGGEIPLENLTLFLHELNSLTNNISIPPDSIDITDEHKSIEEIAYLNSINNKGKYYYINLTGKELKELNYEINIPKSHIQDDMIYQIKPERIVIDAEYTKPM